MGKILGLDLGTKTIGIAVSDSLEIIASALETYRFKENDFDSALKRVIELVDEKKVYKIEWGCCKTVCSCNTLFHFQARLSANKYVIIRKSPVFSSNQFFEQYKKVQ